MRSRSGGGGQAEVGGGGRDGSGDGREAGRGGGDEARGRKSADLCEDRGDGAVAGQRVAAGDNEAAERFLKSGAGAEEGRGQEDVEYNGPGAGNLSEYAQTIK